MRRCGMGFKYTLLSSALMLFSLPAVAQIAPVILNNPTITGGSMNGTSIGLTTPAAGQLTSLIVSGNAGTTLTVNASAVFGASTTQTLTLNGNRIATGGSANTGALVLLLNTTLTGSNSQLFRINGTDGAGNNVPIIDINGSTQSNTTFYNQVRLSNSARGTTYDMLSLGTLTGTPPTGAWNPWLIGYTDNLSSQSSGGNGILNVQETQTTNAATGSRITFGVGYHLTGTSGNTTAVTGQASPGGNYVAATFSATSTANDLGVNNANWGTVNGGGGGFFAQNNTMHLFPGATWTGGINGWENDIEVDNGAQVNIKTGMSIVLMDPADSTTGQGAWEDNAFVFGGGLNAQAAGYGWSNGITFGRPQSAFPFDPDGILINAGPVNGNVTTPITVGIGMDFPLLTFGRAFIRSKQFLVDPNGVARFGTGAIAYTGSGMSVDVNYKHGLAEGSTISGAAIISGGTNYQGKQVFTDDYNGLYTVTATNGSGVITQLTVTRQSFAPVGTSATLTLIPYQYGVINGTVQITQTWTTDNTLTLQPSGGAMAFNGPVNISGSTITQPGTGGPNFIPTWTNVDYSGTIPNPGPRGGPNGSRQFMAYTTLSPSVNTTNTWENMNSFLHFQGPGTANGEINVMHSFFEVEAGATANSSETIEASMGNYGTIGQFVGFLDILHNNSTGVVTTGLVGITLQLTNDNTTAGVIPNYTAIRNWPMAGPGSKPTFNYLIQNTDATASLATNGPVLIGSIGTSDTSKMLQIIGIDSTAANYTMWVNNSSGNIFSLNNVGTLAAVAYKAGAVAGVTCTGTPTASFASTNGIVTHC